jgi:hypothetical protein
MTHHDLPVHKTLHERCPGARGVVSDERGAEIVLLMGASVSGLDISGSSTFRPQRVPRANLAWKVLREPNIDGFETCPASRVPNSEWLGLPVKS